MKRIMTLLLAVLFLFACEEGKDGFTESQIKAQENIYNKTMAVHDEVMPLLSQMVKTSQELQKFIPSNELDPTQKEEIYSAMQTLNMAEESMMGWMAQIKQPVSLRDSMTHETIMAYLENELQTIEEVGKQMKQSLDSGQAVVEKYRNMPAE